MPTFATQLPPEKLAIKNKFIADSGYDPEKFDIDLDNGKFVEKPSALEAAASGAAWGAPDAAVAGGSAGLVSALSAPLRAAPHPLAKVAGFLAPLAASFAGPWLANQFGMQEGKRAMMPSVAASEETAAQLNPTWNTAGSVAANLAGGMKISPATLATTLRGGRSLLAGVPLARMSAAQKGALANTALGAGGGGGAALAEQVTDEKPGVDWSSVLVPTLAGAAFNEPNTIGRRAFGFHSTPKIDTGRNVPTDRTGMAPTEEAQIPAPYRRLMDQLGASQGVDVSYPEKVTDAAGTPVRGAWTPGEKPGEISEAVISNSAGLHDTPPHELLHNLFAQMQGGSPGEKALIERALGAYGGEEALIQAAGERFAGRFNGAPEGALKDLLSFFRDRVMKGGTKSDYANIFANILQRQGNAADITGRAPTRPKPLDVNDPGFWDWLTSSTGEAQPAPAELPDTLTGTPTERPTARVPFDTGEQTYTETGFEGYKPKKPVRILKQPTEDAPWETEGDGGEQPVSLGKQLPPEKPVVPGATGTEPRENPAFKIASKQPPQGNPIESIEPVEADSPTGQQIARANLHEPAVAAAEGGYAEDAQTRYQRFGPTDQQKENVKRRVGLNIFSGEAAKLERAGPEHAAVATKMREVYDVARANRGKYANPIIEAMDTLPTTSKQKVYETLIDERRTQQSLRSGLTPDEQRAYDVIRGTLRQMAQDQITAGQPVWTASGTKRVRGIDPFYFPNVIDRGVRRVRKICRRKSIRLSSGAYSRRRGLTRFVD